jgi:spoIIIJ-associated protein
VEVALEEQAKIAEEFLVQLTNELGLEATVAIAHPEEDTVELQLSGPNLGLLIGPKGATLIAIQNLARTVVNHETGANNGHLNVDVGGYRQKRSEALARFARQVAATVQLSGERTPLEPMSAVDRKVVHDTIGDIDGVSTVSEGEEPHRRVVVIPSEAAS